MGYAFISYSSKNQAEAMKMKALLEKNSIKTWMAPGDIPPASTYAMEINKAIRNCSCMVLMLTRDAQNSVWVSKEVERAVHYRKPVLPIQLEDMQLNDEFEFYISSNQIVRVNHLDSTSPDMQRALATARIHTEKTAAEPSMKTTMPQPVTPAEKMMTPAMKKTPEKPKKKKKWVVVLCLLLLIAGAVFYVLKTDPGIIDRAMKLIETPQAIQYSGNTKRTDSYAPDVNKTTGNTSNTIKLPSSITVKEGEKASVPVNVSGEGLSYKWYFAKKGNSSFQELNARSTLDTFSVIMNHANDGMRVFCAVKDQSGHVTRTTTVTLNMK